MELARTRLAVSSAPAQSRFSTARRHRRPIPGVTGTAPHRRHAPADRCSPACGNSVGPTLGGSFRTPPRIRRTGAGKSSQRLILPSTEDAPTDLRTLPGPDADRVRLCSTRSPASVHVASQSLSVPRQDAVSGVGRPGRRPHRRTAPAAPSVRPYMSEHAFARRRARRPDEQADRWPAG
jgi:hypothetical protein